MSVQQIEKVVPEKYEKVNSYNKENGFSGGL